MRLAAAILLLAAPVLADPLPEGAALDLVSPAPGQLIRDDLPRVDVRWKAEGLPEGALVRVMYRRGENQWWNASGGEYVPVERGHFMWVVPRTREQGDLRLGLLYLAPHEPRTWRVTDDGSFGVAAAGARPGDTVLVEIPSITGGRMLPQGVTLKGNAAGGTSLVLGPRTGIGLTIAGVPGLEASSRVEGIRVRTGAEKPPRVLDYPRGITIQGGSAEVVDCLFDEGLGTGLLASKGGQVVARNCRFDVKGGIGMLAQDPGTVVAMEGGIVTGCSMGITAEGWTSVRAKGVTMEDLVHLGIASRGWPMASAVIEDCRILRARSGISLYASETVEVRGCVFDVYDTAIRVTGQPGTSRTRVVVAGNQVRSATNGFFGGDIAYCDLEKNDFRGIDHVGFRFNCPARLEGNRFEGTNRPSDYASPGYAPGWNLGTTGVLVDTFRGGDKPVLMGNTFRGWSRHAIVLAAGTDATMAENDCGSSGTNVVGHLDPVPEADEQAWGRARGLWEQRHPDERQKR